MEHAQGPYNLSPYTWLASYYVPDPIFPQYDSFASSSFHCLDLGQPLPLHSPPFSSLAARSALLRCTWYRSERPIFWSHSALLQRQIL